MSVQRRRVLVRGDVQGVGFRWWCAREAERLGVAGWVRNLADGSVEVVVEGDDAQVASLVALVGQGPRHARVSAVDVHEEDPEGLAAFEVEP